MFEHSGFVSSTPGSLLLAYCAHNINRVQSDSLVVMYCVGMVGEWVGCRMGFVESVRGPHVCTFGVHDNTRPGEAVY